MVANIQSAIAKLKHKDVRQRRRAVRILFDSDAYESVEAFSPLLDDKDIGFVTRPLKRIEGGPLNMHHIFSSSWQTVTNLMPNVALQQCLSRSMMRHKQQNLLANF